MKYPAYPKYKDSGVEWLGEVPEHWDVNKIKYVARLESGHTPDKQKEEYWTDCDIPWVSLNDSKQLASSDYINETTCQINRKGLENSSARILPARAVVFTRDATIGLAAITCRDMAVSQHVIAWICHLNFVIPEFLLLTIYAMQTYLDSFTFGSTIKTIGLPDVKKLRVPVPTISEQESIVKIVFNNRTKLDTLIAKKRELIDKLNEKRAALITRTVTRGLPPDAATAAGLDPHPKMKDSGVEWLGEVPEHWDVVRFSREIYIAEGQVNPEDEPFSSMLLIAPNHVESGTGKLVYKESASEQSAESGKYYCKSGDVVYSKIRPSLAKVTMAPEDCLCSADMYPLRGRRRLENKYIYWNLLSKWFIAWSILESDRVAMPKINRDSLSCCQLCAPPAFEQRAIAAYLDRETAAIDALVCKVETAIDRLQEYRAALITAAVTGQIDVREAVQ